MKYLEITLKPSGPYFLGNNRSPIREETSRQPYFLTSNRMPSQATLFGITRFIGIRNPQADYHLGENEKYIGKNSFSLTDDNTDFGKLKSISPLMIIDSNGQHYVAAPRNHRAVTDYSYKKKTAVFEPYTGFEKNQVDTLDGERWALSKDEFSVKDHDKAALLCLETGKLIGDIFQTQIQVGINRVEKKAQSQKKNGRENTEQSSFFKKEYTIMPQEYAFIYYAELSDDAFGKDYGFTEKGHTTVLVGQSSTPFSAEWHTVDKPLSYRSYDTFTGCFPKYLYAYAASDIYFEGSITKLKQHCMLALADVRDIREFRTNYNTGSTMHGRYTKKKEALRLMKAGSVFVFRDAQQQTAFKQLLEESAHFTHGKIAGFNEIYYSDMEETR